MAIRFISHRVRNLRWALVLMPTLAACAPVPMTPERAERLCREEAGLADGIGGTVGIGVGTGGALARGDIVLTDRVFNPQSEAEYMQQCVARRLNGDPQPTRVGITIGAST